MYEAEVHRLIHRSVADCRACSYTSHDWVVDGSYYGRVGVNDVNRAATATVSKARAVTANARGASVTETTFVNNVFGFRD